MKNEKNLFLPSPVLTDTQETRVEHLKTRFYFETVENIKSNSFFSACKIFLESFTWIKHAILPPLPQPFLLYNLRLLNKVSSLLLPFFFGEGKKTWLTAQFCFFWSSQVKSKKDSLENWGERGLKFRFFCKWAQIF